MQTKMKMADLIELAILLTKRVGGDEVTILSDLAREFLAKGHDRERVIDLIALRVLLGNRDMEGKNQARARAEEIISDAVQVAAMTRVEHVSVTEVGVKEFSVAHLVESVLRGAGNVNTVFAQPDSEPEEEIKGLFSDLVRASHSRITGDSHHLEGLNLTEHTASTLKSAYSMSEEDALYIGGIIVEYADVLATHIKPDYQAVEAVQIEWISNGVLVRGRGADGAFCNYYRDTSTFVSQHLNGEMFEFVKDKEPKTGDKCIVYFGLADVDSE